MVRRFANRTGDGGRGWRRQRRSPLKELRREERIQTQRRAYQQCGGDVASRPRRLAIEFCGHSQSVLVRRHPATITDQPAGTSSREEAALNRTYSRCFARIRDDIDPRVEPRFALKPDSSLLPMTKVGGLLQSQAPARTRHPAFHAHHHPVSSDVHVMLDSWISAVCGCTSGGSCGVTKQSQTLPSSKAMPSHPTFSLSPRISR